MPISTPAAAVSRLAAILEALHQKQLPPDVQQHLVEAEVQLVTLTLHLSRPLPERLVREMEVDPKVLTVVRLGLCGVSLLGYAWGCVREGWVPWLVCAAAAALAALIPEPASSDK